MLVLITGKLVIRTSTYAPNPFDYIPISVCPESIAWLFINEPLEIVSDEFDLEFSQVFLALEIIEFIIQIFQWIDFIGFAQAILWL